MAAKEIIEVPVVSETIRRAGVPLSPCVRANGFVFVSGLPPVDLSTGAIVTGDVEAQAEASLRALRHALEAAGSSLAKVVKVTVYAANSGHYARINRVYARFFPEAPPARTFVAVGSWPMEFDLEVECVALA